MDGAWHFSLIPINTRSPKSIYSFPASSLLSNRRMNTAYLPSKINYCRPFFPPFHLFLLFYLFFECIIPLFKPRIPDARIENILFFIVESKFQTWNMLDYPLIEATYVSHYCLQAVFLQTIFLHALAFCRDLQFNHDE